MNAKRFTAAAAALFSVTEQTHSALVICSSEWVTVALYNPFWISTNVVTAPFSCYMAGAMWNCCHLSASSVHTIQPCTSLQCHFIPNHLYRVRVCLAVIVTCHLQFWQNDQDGLHATVVTQERNRHQNKSTESSMSYPHSPWWILSLNFSFIGCACMHVCVVCKCTCMRALSLERSLKRKDWSEPKTTCIICWLLDHFMYCACYLMTENFELLIKQ